MEEVWIHQPVLNGIILFIGIIRTESHWRHRFDRGGVSGDHMLLQGVMGAKRGATQRACGLRVHHGQVTVFLGGHPSLVLMPFKWRKDAGIPTEA